MSTMSDAGSLKRLYVRANAESRRALRLLRAKLLAVPETEDVSQEELVSASWLWMVREDPETLARALAPHVAAIRASLASATQPAAGKIALEETPEPKPPLVQVVRARNSVPDPESNKQRPRAKKHPRRS